MTHKLMELASSIESLKETATESGNLSKTDLAILNKIYSSKDPDAMRDYIYELLTNPLKFQEELAKHGVPLEA